MFKIHDLKETGYGVVENEMKKMNQDLDPFKTVPHINKVFIFDKAFPEFFISTEQDEIIRKILNGD